MKYTIDEENKIVTIHSVGNKITVEYLMMILRDLDEFEIRFEINSNQSHTMITDSGYKYDYVPDTNPYKITAINEDLYGCECGKNGGTCTRGCGTKNKK